MSDQPAAEPAPAAPEPAAASAPEPAAASAAPPAASAPTAAPESAAPPPAAEPPPPAPPKVDAAEAIAGFVDRIGQGEFDQPEDAFHRFVVKEIYPLLGSGTLTAKDLDLIAHVYSARSDPYNRGYDTPEDAPKLAVKPK